MYKTMAFTGFISTADARSSKLRRKCDLTQNLGPTGRGVVQLLALHQNIGQGCSLLLITYLLLLATSYHHVYFRFNSGGLLCQPWYFLSGSLRWTKGFAWGDSDRTHETQCRVMTQAQLLGSTLSEVSMIPFYNGVAGVLCAKLAIHHIPNSTGNNNPNYHCIATTMAKVAVQHISRVLQSLNCFRFSFLNHF